MKHNWFIDFLNDLGLVWKYALNGLVGGFIWSLYKKKKFWECVRQVIIGGVVSGYFTPVIVVKTNMDLSYVGFTSFVIGLLGLVIIDSIYKVVIGKIKKWKKVIDILKKSN